MVVTATGIYIIIIWFFSLPIDNARLETEKYTEKNGQNDTKSERERESVLSSTLNVFYPCEYNTCYPFSRSDVVVVVYAYLITNDSRGLYLLLWFLFSLFLYNRKLTRIAAVAQYYYIIITTIRRAPEMKASRGNDCCAGHNI